MTFTVSRIQRNALGCGENTMELPDLIAISALYKTVDVRVGGPDDLARVCIAVARE